MEKNECYRCGLLATQGKLFDAVSREGVVKICESCSIKDDIPVIKKPTDFQLKEAERPSTVFERLSRSAGLDPNEVRERRTNEARGREVKKQDVNLRKIVDDNFKAKVMNKPASNIQIDLVDNFHWAIMRARRAKHLTQKDLADVISVPESAIRLLEQKILPEDNYQLVNKVEQFLRVKIRKNPVEPQKQKVNWDGEFSPDKIGGLSIGDLKKMKEEHEGKMQPPVEEKKKGWFSGLFSKKDKKAGEDNSEIKVEEIDVETLREGKEKAL